MAGGWLMSTVVLSASVAATFSSQLSVTDLPERIDTLKDILKYPDVRPYITKGITVDSHLQLSDSPIKRKVFEQAVRFDAIRSFGDFFTTSMFNEISNGDAVVISNIEYSFYSFVSFYCGLDRRSFHISEQPFLTIPTVFTFRKGLDPALIETMNKRSTIYSSAGFHHIPIRLAAAKALPCLHQVFSRSTFKPLNFRDVYQVFHLLLVGLGLGITTFAVEMSCVLMKKSSFKRFFK